MHAFYGHDHGKMTEDWICWRKVLLCYALLLMFPCSAQDAGSTSHDAVLIQEDNEDCFLDSFEVSSCPPGYHKRVDERLSDIDIEERCGLHCCFCAEDTYQPVHNECPSCIMCTNCTARGRTEIQACNITHNTVCGKRVVEPTRDDIGVTPEDRTITTAGTTTQEMHKPHSTTSIENPDETEECSCFNAGLVTGLVRFVVTAIAVFVGTSLLWIFHHELAKKVLEFFQSFRRGRSYSPTPSS